MLKLITGALTRSVGVRIPVAGYSTPFHWHIRRITKPNWYSSSSHALWQPVTGASAAGPAPGSGKQQALPRNHAVTAEPVHRPDLPRPDLTGVGILVDAPLRLAPTRPLHASGRSPSLPTTVAKRDATDHRVERAAGPYRFTSGVNRLLHQITDSCAGDASIRLRGPARHQRFATAQTKFEAHTLPRAGGHETGRQTKSAGDGAWDRRFTYMQNWAH